MAASMKMTAFWDIAPIALMMEAANRQELNVLILFTRTSGFKGINKIYRR
jgi:hypothetical protein